MTKENKNSVTLDTYDKLYQLFKDKGWDIDNESNSGIFGRYYRTLERLNHEQQIFLLELSKGFLHIPGDSYTEHLIPAFKKLIDDYPECILYLACCLPEKEQGKIKISTTVLYKFK